MSSVFERPVIVVGAGRSGTTMMREALGSHPELQSLRYEMNYLWRTGNAGLDHDFLTPEAHLRPGVSAAIRDGLQRELSSDTARMVEKTVANVVRIRFVQAVFQDALFVHVIRDGRAVTASAMRRWQKGSSAGYLASKARTVPLQDLPAVAVRYVKRLAQQKIGRRDHAISWGPRWPGMDLDVKELPLASLCARQWSLCVREARAQAKLLAGTQYLEVRYEDLVSEPRTEFRRVAEFAGVDPEQDRFMDHVIKNVRTGSLDRWREDLDQRDLDTAHPELEPLLSDLGYDSRG